MEKLVRDKIPQIIKSKGEIPIIRIASSDSEYTIHLKDKLFEEIEELYLSKNRLHMVEEMADIMEVINTIMSFYNLSTIEVEQARKKKLAERGGFSKRIIWSDGK